MEHVANVYIYKKNKESCKDQQSIIHFSFEMLVKVLNVYK